MRCLAVLGCLIWFAACGNRTAPPNEVPNSAPETGASPGLIVVPADSPQLEQIRVEPVQLSNVAQEEVGAPGKIEANPNRISKLLLPVAGRITSVSAKVGDRVAAGQTLVTVESPDADAAMAAYHQSEAAINQAKATLSQATSAHTKTQRDWERLTDLYEHNAVAKKDLVSAENDLAQAKAAIEQAKAGIEQAQAAREQAVRRLTVLGLKPGGEYGQQVAVRAPISGKVLDKAVAPGEYRTDTTAPLMTIADLSSVVMTADVPENSIRLIKVGEPVTIELNAFPGEPFSGQVTRIADMLDPQTRTAKVQAELKNPQERFRPEMFGRIRFSRGTAQTPVVPSGALVQRDGKNVVFVERSRGSFEMREVTVGAQGGDSVAILKGLSGGERVVTNGTMLLMKDQAEKRP